MGRENESANKVACRYLRSISFWKGRFSVYILCSKVDQSNLSTLWAMERVVLQPDIAFRQYFTHFGLREYFVGSLPCT